MGKSSSFGLPYSLCIMTICNFSFFPLLFRGQDFGSDCISSWSLLTFYFSDGWVTNSVLGSLPDERRMGKFVQIIMLSPIPILMNFFFNFALQKHSILYNNTSFVCKVKPLCLPIRSDVALDARFLSVHVLTVANF